MASKREYDGVDHNEIKRRHILEDELDGERTIRGGVLKIRKMLPSKNNKYDPLAFFKDKYGRIIEIVSEYLEEKGGLKFYISLKMQLSKKGTEREVITTPGF